MKIVREGAPREPAQAWRSRLWRCNACDTVALFEPHDHATFREMLVFMAGERFHTEHVWAFCPTCGYNRAWTEQTAEDEAADAVKEAGNAGDG